MVPALVAEQVEKEIKAIKEEAQKLAQDAESGVVE
jgi:hypothetical protein